MISLLYASFNEVDEIVYGADLFCLEAQCHNILHIYTNIH